VARRREKSDWMRNHEVLPSAMKQALQAIVYQLAEADTAAGASGFSSLA
jgi:hypothetical protein